MKQEFPARSLLSKIVECKSGRLLLRGLVGDIGLARLTSPMMFLVLLEDFGGRFL